MLRLPFASLAAATGLTLAVFGGPLVSSADGGASVTIHEGADATTWGYTPAAVTVQVGDTVTWTNSGTQPDDANSTDGSWHTALLNNGQSAAYTFTTPGTYTYICTPHPWMKGTIVVTAAGAPAAVSSDTGTAATAPTTVPSDPGTASVDTSVPAPTDTGAGG